MKKSTLYTMVGILFFVTSCSKDDGQVNTVKDLSGELFNEVIMIKTPDNRDVKAYISKPKGENIDIVLALHGGSTSQEASQNSTETYIDKDDGGKQFLDAGYGVLCLEYTEYDDANTKSDRGFKELVDVLAATDYILNDSLSKHNVNVNRIFSFGHSRGGANALLAGIERKIDGAIAAEAPLDWVKTRDSIHAGVITGDPNEVGDLIDLFEQSITNWNDDDFIKYSPGLRLTEFQSKFLIISGELDPAVLISIAVDVKDNYLLCNANNNCINGGEFIFHDRGHTDWADPEILQNIQDFMNN